MAGQPCQTIREHNPAPDVVTGKITQSENTILLHDLDNFADNPECAFNPSQTIRQDNPVVIQTTPQHTPAPDVVDGSQLSATIRNLHDQAIRQDNPATRPDSYGSGNTPGNPGKTILLHDQTPMVLEIHSCTIRIWFPDAVTCKTRQSGNTILFRTKQLQDQTILHDPFERLKFRLTLHA